MDEDYDDALEDQASGVSEAQLEQYRQAANDLRHYDSFIWQNTVATVLTISVAAGAVLVNDVHPGIRAIILATLASLLGLMWIALFKHRWGTDTRTEILENVERAWQQRGLIHEMIHRRSDPICGDKERTAYVCPSFPPFSVVTAFKFMMVPYIVGVLALGILYFALAVGSDWPEFLQDATKPSPSPSPIR